MTDVYSNQHRNMHVMRVSLQHYKRQLLVVPQYQTDFCLTFDNLIFGGIFQNVSQQIRKKEILLMYLSVDV
jgi:hypothetical protein